jgi:hypothetical protein
MMMDMYLVKNSFGKSNLRGFDLLEGFEKFKNLSISMRA